MIRNLLLLGATSTVLMTGTVSAQVTDYNIFEEDFLTQTGPSTTASNSWTVTANVTLENSIDASSVTVTALSSQVYAVSDTSEPGASPSYYASQQGFLTQGAAESAFPPGSPYLFSVSGGTLGSDNGTLNFPTEGTGAGELSYPSAVPLITDYSALQGLNASQPFVVQFSGFNGLTGTGQQSLLFLDVYDASTNAEVFSDNLLSSSTTSVDLPANLLQPGTAYYVALDYSNRQYTADDGFVASSGGVQPFAALDYNTSADFSTAPIPEPATGPMLLAGVGLLIFGRWFFRRPSQVSRKVTVE